MSSAVSTSQQVPTAAATVLPPLRITARGRAVVTGLVALPFIAIVVFLVLNGGGAIASASGSSVPLESVTVMAGQSLWEVAETLAPQEDPREVIADLVAINTLASAEVRPGQQLDIPSQYSN